ncbi:DUF805 domain-containing protein [Caminibacter pacificus]
MLELLFSFKGRINRLKYFAIMLGLFLVSLAPDFVCKNNPDSSICMIFLLLVIPMIWVNFAIIVKRFHDLNRSGWWALLMLVPVVNFIIGLFLLFKKGTEGANDFGADPLANS